MDKCGARKEAVVKFTTTTTMESVKFESTILKVFKFQPKPEWRCTDVNPHKNPLLFL